MNAINAMNAVDKLLDTLDFKIDDEPRRSIHQVCDLLTNAACEAVTRDHGGELPDHWGIIMSEIDVDEHAVFARANEQLDYASVHPRHQFHSFLASTDFMQIFE